MTALGNTLLGASALVVSIGTLIFSYLDRPPMIGYAETSVLLADFSESIKARKEFEAAQTEWDKNLKALNDSLMATMERMKLEYDKASESEKEALRGLLQKRNEDLQRYTNAVKKLSQEKEKELMEPVIGKMNSFLNRWGKENGFDMILGTMSGGNILQANSEFNVTSRVLKELNGHYNDLPGSQKAELGGHTVDTALNSPGTERTEGPRSANVSP